MSINAAAVSRVNDSRSRVRRTESAKVCTMNACRLKPALCASFSSCALRAAGNFTLVGLLAVLVAGILHDGVTTVQALKQVMREAGLPVRLTSTGIAA